MPAVFVGHGSPMNAIEENAFHFEWVRLAERLPKPKAILCISAHWHSQNGTKVTGAGKPVTIHDFFGFPQRLFRVEYPAQGDLLLARHIADLLGGQKIAQVDATRGLDHGAWSVLRAMYPRAEFPVLQLSLDIDKPAEHHYELAQMLDPLRDEGVLILGSGNIVHNLALWDWRDPKPLDWAVRFDAAVKRRVIRGEHIELVEWERLGEDSKLAIPTPDHYLPLLYVLAVQRETDLVSFFNEEVIGGISMTSVELTPPPVRVRVPQRPARPPSGLVG